MQIIVQIYKSILVIAFLFLFLGFCIMKYAHPWSSVHCLKNTEQPWSRKADPLTDSECVCVCVAPHTLTYCSDALWNSFFHWPKSQLSCVEACRHTLRKAPVTLSQTHSGIPQIATETGMQWELCCLDSSELYFYLCPVWTLTYVHKCYCTTV